jgi:hypothetical protein
MERKVVIYLKRIVKTISIMLVWMIINTRLGINSNYAFFEDKITTANVLFYLWFVISLAALLFFFYKLWKDDVGFDEEEAPSNPTE